MKKSTCKPRKNTKQNKLSQFHNKLNYSVHGPLQRLGTDQVRLGNDSPKTATYGHRWTTLQRKSVSLETEVSGQRT